MSANEILRLDLAVIGGGPGGQKAAIEAAKCGRNVALIEKSARPGGACVRRGTIPSKALHEVATSILRLENRNIVEFERFGHSAVPLEAMMHRVESVVSAHESCMARQLEDSGVRFVRGMARFTGDLELEVRNPRGECTRIIASRVIIATGSRPRDPGDIPVDHENILDSDSILSLHYLPESMVVLGSGVIACEYASIFAALGTRVTIVDKWPLPLGFLDRELCQRFVERFEAAGGEFVGDTQLERVEWDGASSVVTRLTDGREIRSEKLLFALGRVPNLERLGLDAVGLTPNEKGILDVDEGLRTHHPAIYAVGDVIGPPALAATAMEQGRRAARHACGFPVDGGWRCVPIGIYAIPELASVGLSESRARAEDRDVIVGRAEFGELARGLIAGATGGFLKIVADANDGAILGVQALGEGVAELIHLGQAALLSRWSAGDFIDNIFNFPTLAESYRVAALDVVRRLETVAAPVA